MPSRPLYAISYHLDTLLRDARELFFLKGCIVWAQGEQIADAALSYRSATVGPRGPKRLGASETLGIFGGVSDAEQAILSEVTERNIGDLVVWLLSHCTDELARERPAAETPVVLILGPPLPKVVGRIASIRLPRSVHIAWVYTFPPPKWFASFPGWATALRAGHQPARLWMEDELIIEERRILQNVEYRVAWLNQYVDYENVYGTDWVNELLGGRLVTVPWSSGDPGLPELLRFSMLLTLAQRTRLVRPTWTSAAASMPQILAGGFLSLQDGAALAEELERRTEILTEEIAKLPGGLLRASRKRTGLTLEECRILADHWQDLRDSMKSRMGESPAGIAAVDASG